MLLAEKIDLLAYKIQQKIGKPISINVVQAIIESFGIREIDVKNDYGYDTINLLAQNIYEKLQARTVSTIIPIEKEQLYNQKINKEDIYSFLKNFVVGIIHVFPIFFQILCVIFFGYSLWVYSNFNILQSTSVVIGVITSLVLTGGVITVMSKQISFFWNYKNHKMLFQHTVYLVSLGIKILFFSNVLLILSSLLLGIFSIEMALLSAVYSISIGIILLLIAPLYVFKQHTIISLTIITGSVFSLLLKHFTPLSIYVTHWLGIVAVIILLILYLVKYFKNSNVFDSKFTHNDVKKEFIIYNNYTYFFYGTFFFIYVFLDRILAWSSQEKLRFSYFIFFEKDYEIGMDIALLTYLLVAGVFEYSVSDFAKKLDALQDKINLEHIYQYGKFFIKRYIKSVILLSCIACLSFLIQCFILYSKHGYNAVFEEQLNDINKYVCILGSLGYFFFSWAVLNVLHFFTLGQPTIPFRGLIIALLINLGIGILLSRCISYELSVVGFLVGSIGFMLYTTKELITFFNKLDYYYYASF